MLPTLRGASPFNDTDPPALSITLHAAPNMQSMAMLLDDDNAQAEYLLGIINNSSTDAEYECRENETEEALQQRILDVTSNAQRATTELFALGFNPVLSDGRYILVANKPDKEEENKASPERVLLTMLSSLSEYLNPHAPPFFPPSMPLDGGDLNATVGLCDNRGCRNNAHSQGLCVEVLAMNKTLSVKNLIRQKGR
jgi:hypothetical protein